MSCVLPTGKASKVAVPPRSAGLSRVSRRTLLAALAAFVTSANGVTGVRPSWAQGTGGTVDVHCHVFNASDLPVRGFLQRVVFEDYGEQATDFALPSPLAALIAVLVDFLQVGVPSAEEELADLGEGAGDLALPFDPTGGDAVDALASALERVFGSGDASALSADPDAVSLSEQDVEAFRTAVQLELALEGESSESNEFLSEFGGLALALFDSDGAIGRTIRWAGWLRAPRMQIVEEYLRLYSSDGEIALLTPALVDFSAWLDDEPDSSIASQILTMEAVQRQCLAQHGTLLHCYAPFDPWRQLAHTGAGRSPLELVQDAVEQRGFIGVKLYPPMGFRPAGNRSGNLTFPAGSAAIADFAGKLDGALEQLFAWAADHDVPILAHAANGNGSGPMYSERANPANWRAVLEAHPGLRICLAHFGDFDPVPDVGWEQQTTDLMRDFGNVHADISFLHSVLAGGRHEDEAVEKLATALGNSAVLAQRLVYGTDWNMLGREAGHERYFESTMRALRRAGLQDAGLRAVRRNNAVHFFGLSSGSRTRERLAAWYQRHGLDGSGLDKLAGV